MTEVIESGPPWPVDVVDHDRWGEFVSSAIKSLNRAKERGRFPQSLLVVGPRGMGRELVALAASCLLICPEGGCVDCQCGSCRRIRDGIHPDMVVVQPDGRQIKIEQIRKGVVNVAAGRPYEAERRVWVLDSVEAGVIGKEAANAFLKTLEEPPDHVNFVLLASSAAAVLPTIRSRCQILRLPGAVAVASRLAEKNEVPELGPFDEGSPTAELVAVVQAMLDRALAKQSHGMLAVAARLAQDPRGFELTAAVALAAAGSGDDDQRGELLVHLAASLLWVERRTNALNLNRGRQLQSCLLNWFESIP